VVRQQALTPPYRQAAEDGLTSYQGKLGIEGLLHRVREETIGFRQLEGGSWHTLAARAALERWEGSVLADAAVQGGYSLRQILEGEAACHVERFLTDAALSPETPAELNTYAALWMIGEMPDVYGAAVENVVAAIANELPTAENLRTLYPAAVRIITPWLLDLAQSYPPPGIADTFGADAAMFDPVVRCLVLYRALNKMSADDYVSMYRSIVEDVWEAERILLRSSSFPYPSSREIYTEWIAVLDGALAENSWDQPFAPYSVRRDRPSARVGPSQRDPRTDRRAPPCAHDGRRLWRPWRARRCSEPRRGPRTTRGGPL
jgi:hypothetical protein